MTCVLWGSLVLIMVPSDPMDGCGILWTLILCVQDADMSMVLLLNVRYLAVLSILCACKEINTWCVYSRF